MDIATLILLPVVGAAVGWSVASIVWGRLLRRERKQCDDALSLAERCRREAGDFEQIANDAVKTDRAIELSLHMGEGER